MEITTLIAKCKEDDRSAQGLLYETYKVKLFALCLKYCRNYDEAEDILQESFIAIFTKIHQYHGKGSFEGWMTRITINNAINKYKKHIYTKPVEDAYISEPIIEIEQPKHTLNEILELVQELPDQYRLVFSLYELDNFSHKEIAKLLGIAETTSKSNLHRAKQRLKKRLLEKEKILTSYGR